MYVALDPVAMPAVKQIDRSIGKHRRQHHEQAALGGQRHQVRLDGKEAVVDIVGLCAKLAGQPTDVLRGTQAEQDQIDDIYQEGLEQEGECPAGEQGVDRLAGDVADKIAADIAAHKGVDDQGQIGDAAKEQMAEPVELEKDKGEEIEVEHRKQQHQGDAFVEAALQTDLEKINGPLQGEELGRNVLALALDHIELLDLGDGTEQVDRLVDPAAIGGNDLGVGVVCPFGFPFLGHQLSWSLPVWGLTLRMSRSRSGLARSISAMEPKASAWKGV